MDLEKMIAGLDNKLKRDYGWRLPFIKAWWAVEDWWYGSALYDLWWWVTDGKPQWSDAEECERRICCKCGKKPRLFK